MWDLRERRGVLTGGQETVAHADVALVAHEDEPALVLVLVAGFARGLLLGRHVAAVRDAAADDDGVVVVEIPAWPHLADVRPERALFVLVDGVEVEVVRPVVLAFAFLVVVRAHVNGGSWRWGSLISEDTGRQACNEGVVGNIPFFHRPMRYAASFSFGSHLELAANGVLWVLSSRNLMRVYISISRSEYAGREILLVELRNKLLQIADNHKTAISCPVRLTHLVALVSGKYHSKTQENNQ